MKKIIATLFFTITIFFFLSCGSMTAIKEHTGHGDVKVYNAPYETVWTLLVDIVRSSKLVVHEINEKEGIIYGEGKAGGFTWGEYVGIWVTKNKDNTKCKVEIDIERKLKTNITAHQWGDEFFEKLDSRLFEEF